MYILLLTSRISCPRLQFFFHVVLFKFNFHNNIRELVRPLSYCISITYFCFCNFRLLPRCKWGMGSFGILRGVEYVLLRLLDPWSWTDRLTRNVGKNYHSTLRKIPKERRSRSGTCFIGAWNCNICSSLYTSQLLTTSFSKTLQSVQSASGCFILVFSFHCYQ